jgi:uncharacterized membrane-anchored protein
MRTEGVIVEAMLGQASSLDAYAEQLQLLEVRRREAEVAKLEAESARAALINQIAQSKDLDMAKALALLTCPCGPEVPRPVTPTPTPTPP